MAIIGFFVYSTRPGPCDTIFEQTAPKLDATVHLLKTKSEMIISRDKIQELAESAQRVGILCKTCCVAQQSGRINAAQFQDCLNTTKNYETQVLQVASSIDAANTARQQRHEEIANQQVQHAQQALAGAASAAQKLNHTVAGISSSPAPAATASVIPAAGAPAQPREPNDTIFQANSFPIGTPIAGVITNTDNVDYFRFRYDSQLRDIIDVRLDNTSTSLMPQITIYDSDKSQLQNNYSITAGANVALSFVAEPGRDYYAGVSGFSGSAGSYTLSLVPRRAYDHHEPNDNASTATPVTVGQVLSANIMDSQDVDWYRLRAIARPVNIDVRVDNTSTSLMPQITIYDSDKSQLQNNYSITAGANVALSFAAESGRDYYVKVSGFSGSAGSYTLSLTSQPR